jgi:CheY-like chemotaxis protein
MELLGATIPDSVEEKHALYREKLRECYLKGEPTIDEAKRIMALKELLELTFDEHLAIETDIRLDLYVDHVERKIVSGEVNLKDVDALDELKGQFHITPEESARLEPYILSCLQRLAVKGKLLIVDDDLLLLQTLDDYLSKAGYQIVPAESVAAAMEYLKSATVDLILSDIKFNESDLDGFQFYLSVQAQPHLRSIPFVIMSSLRDGVIIRSGVQLGVDDYLTKPVDPDLLIAVIEGKLKRYRNFDRG